VGDNPFALVGGAGAVWVRAFEVTGKVEVRATHPYLGMQKVEIEVAAAKDELV
jgi:beta-galactosidase